MLRLVRASPSREWDGVTAATTKPVAREAMASMLRFFMPHSTADPPRGHGRAFRNPRSAFHRGG
ncbi:hypothetical protein GCM10010372_39430 [Streptomyces tauricus]|nr:hypothetical protein GCM10010372_39430 [Streptomyces tauricus]